MKVVKKCRVCHTAKVMTDTSQSEIHFCKTVSCRLFLLPVNVNTADIAAFFSNKVGALNEHTARTAARVRCRTEIDTM